MMYISSKSPNLAIVGFVAMARRCRDKLQKERARVLGAEETKHRFFTLMNHNLRMPLNAIVGFSELLEMGIDDPQERKKYLSNVIFSSHALQELVNDALGFFKQDTGALPLELEFCDVGKIADNLLLLFQPAMQKEGVALKNDYDDMPLLEIDPRRFRQIMFCLIDNSVKYTHGGKIRVNLAFKPEKNAFGMLRMTISDTGMGIFPRQLENLRNAFAQPGSLMIGDGIGTGMKICKQMLSDIHGKVLIDSNFGMGTEVTVENHEIRYKMRKQEQPLTAEEIKAQLPKGYDMKTLLLVDDSRLNLDVLKAMLERLGMKKILISDSVDAATSVLKTQKADLVLTDMWMPEKDGAQLVVELREKMYVTDCPIYVVTADIDVADNYKVRGFDGILIKPLTLERLAEVIEKAFRQDAGKA